MSVLLLRLIGPMQSWGVQSRYKERETGLEPSKSGVVGLLCAALGRPRNADIRDVAGLKMGVRVDCPGTVSKDFHAAQNVRVAKATSKQVIAVLTGKRRDPTGQILRASISNRYYLSDARFLVGLQSDDLALLTQLHAALRDPHWPLCLGRKAFVPGEPVWLRDGLRPDEDLMDLLHTYLWLGCDPKKRPEQVRLVLDDPENGPETRPDLPLSFAQRRFAPRRVRTDFVPAPPLREEEELCISLA